MRSPLLLPWIGLMVRLAAPAVWLFAGVTKLADLNGFRLQVDAYDMVPGAVVAGVAYALPLLEVVLGVYLLVGALVRPVAIVSCGLMGLFEAQALARGLSVDCGCFGTAVETQVRWTTIARDAALGIPFYLLAWRPARKLSVDQRVLGRDDALGRLAGA